MPSNCNQCGTRGSVREHQGIMDTFERYEVGTWQCVNCGIVFERGVGKSFKPIGQENIIMRPYEMKEMRKERADQNLNKK